MRQTLATFGIFLICLGLPIAGWIYFDRQIPVWIPTIEHRGIYGDQFGALNALFAGLAAGGVVFTLFLTYQQLRLQHREFERTTASLQANQAELAEQTKLLTEQIADSIPRTHRVVAAEDRLDFADLMLSKVKDSLEEAMLFIEPADKRQEAQNALAESDLAWKTHMEAIISFSASASPLPGGSTSTLASVTSIQARMTEERARELAEWAEWIQTNFRP